MTTRRTRRPRARTWVKDVVSYLGGWGLIIHQVQFVPRGDFNLWALILGGLLVGVPGLGQLSPYLVQIIARQLGIESSLSLPPSEESQQLRRSSSPGSGAEE